MNTVDDRMTRCDFTESIFDAIITATSFELSIGPL